MPRTDVVFYQEAEGDVPVLDWLKRLRRSDQRAYAKCIASIERLAEFGHELRGERITGFCISSMEGIWRFWHMRLQRRAKCQMPILKEPFGEGKLSRRTRQCTRTSRRRSKSWRERKTH